MEVENCIPEPDEFSHRNEKEPTRRAPISLLRGYSVQDPENFVIPALSCRRRSVEKILGVLPRPVASSASREAIIIATENGDEQMDIVEDIEPDIPEMQTRRATISSGAQNPYKKRPSTLRDWPFGEPKVKNDEDFFELELNTGLFTPEEVSAKVMGKELIIHCKPIAGRRSSKEPTPREIFRCYPLPLTIAPLVSDVSIVKDDHWVRVAIRKESALRSPIGLFTPEMAEIAEEEQRVDGVDVEEDEPEPEVRMDD